MEKLYIVFFMMEELETGYQKVFAQTAQEAADKIRAKKDVLEVFNVLLPVDENWR